MTRKDVASPQSDSDPLMNIEQEMFADMRVQTTLRHNVALVGATPEMVKFYQEQDKGLLVGKTSKIFQAAVKNTEDRPDVTTVLWVKGEGGGNGKTERAARMLAMGSFDPGFIEDHYDKTGYELQLRYIAMTTVGQDLQKEYDSNGKQVVDKTAPNWTVDHLRRIRTRMEDVVSTATPRFQDMNRSIDPDKKVTTLLIVEDLTGFDGVDQFGRRIVPITRDHFGMWIITNPMAQENASRQRVINEDPNAKLSEVYKSAGGVIVDKPELVGTDALDYMGNAASKKRAWDRMNGYLWEARDELMKIKRVSQFNLNDLETDPRFRNEDALQAFYEMRIEELGFRRGHAAVVENPYIEGLPYNLELIRKLKVNSTEYMRWLA